MRRELFSPAVTLSLDLRSVFALPRSYGLVACSVCAICVICLASSLCLVPVLCSARGCCILIVLRLCLPGVPVPSAAPWANFVRKPAPLRVWALEVQAPRRKRRGQRPKASRAAAPNKQQQAHTCICVLGGQVVAPGVYVWYGPWNSPGPFPRHGRGSKLWSAGVVEGCSIQSLRPYLWK